MDLLKCPHGRSELALGRSSSYCVGQQSISPIQVLSKGTSRRLDGTPSKEKGGQKGLSDIYENAEEIHIHVLRSQFYLLISV